jgi:hypothetical protein
MSFLRSNTVRDTKKSKYQKTFNELYNKRKSKEKALKIGKWTFFISEIVFVIAFTGVSYKEFRFGIMLAFIINLFNICVYLIFQYFVNPVIKHKKDSGLIIWWMCCLRVGHTQSYLQSLKKNDINALRKRQLKKEENADVDRTRSYNSFSQILSANKASIFSVFRKSVVRQPSCRAKSGLFNRRNT